MALNGDCFNVFYVSFLERSACIIKEEASNKERYSQRVIKWLKL